ncbi:MAG: hypothetical protein IJT36_02865 [Alphaproteobacteria bacterium]|nr:hypothetical protein [Alphaproteobacteria bacterium]
MSTSITTGVGFLDNPVIVRLAAGYLIDFLIALTTATPFHSSVSCWT